MQKIMLAIGQSALEEYLKNRLQNEYSFINLTVYREGIAINMKKNVPDILILAESLEGKVGITEIVQKIRVDYGQKVRIIFLGEEKELGNELLSHLVGLGVFDIICGTNIDAKKVIELVRKPQEYKDVMHYQLFQSIDEEGKKMLTVAPKVVKEEKIVEVPMPVVAVNTEKAEKIEEDIEIQKQKEKKKGFGFFSLPTSSTGGTEKENKQKGTSLGTGFSASKGIPLTSKGIVTFAGGKGGIGNTLVAFNTAMLLAEKGKKVIYLEINPTNPAVNYWYEIPLLKNIGLDTILDDINNGDFSGAKNGIITAKIKGDQVFTLNNPDKKIDPKTFNKIPLGIDLMFFSLECVTENRSYGKINFSKFKDLFLHLFYQLGYDFVIIDIPLIYSYEAGISDVFRYSNKIFTTVSQDIVSVGYTLNYIHEIGKMGISYENNNTFIMNNYEKSKMDINALKDWLKVDELILINRYKDFSDLNLEGKPILYNEKNASFRASISTIVKNIK